ncbi:MAG: hypothetical protein ALECFALPRED_004833 [Alectoria fallacina]|uniref:Uncharacterized protein n=1 Tax=Alectoria fallacina TaxID=1903189 RepID=A0A8H3EEJ2_9LECA|nr:MAG: hypothetical protein ALECFALPRED_004833 [Alectoria fallacina]
MVNLFLPLLLGLATSSIKAASLPTPPLGPSIPMNLSGLYSFVTNTASSLGGGVSAGIDPRFSVNYELGAIPLRPIACLMNAVNAMTNLALQDFDGIVRPVVVRLPDYPDVVIRSGAKTLVPGTMPIRYILWGVWSFARFMMSNNAFQTMHMTLSFDRVIVGYLRIEKPDLQILGLAGSSNDSSAESLKKRSDVALPAIPASKTLASFTMISNSTSLSLANTTTPSNAGDLHVFFKPIGHFITNEEFFIPILAGLAYVAHFPSTSPVVGFRLRPVGSNTWIEFRDIGAQPRSEAPFFEWQWIAKALGGLPGHMVLLGEWREAIIVMQVDGISVGDGWIRKGQI